MGQIFSAERHELTIFGVVCKRIIKGDATVTFIRQKISRYICRKKSHVQLVACDA